jgi:hypothetical protein
MSGSLKSRVSRLLTNISSGQYDQKSKKTGMRILTKKSSACVPSMIYSGQLGFSIQPFLFGLVNNLHPAIFGDCATQGSAHRFCHGFRIISPYAFAGLELAVIRQER